MILIEHLVLFILIIFTSRLPASTPSWVNIEQLLQICFTLVPHGGGLDKAMRDSYRSSRSCDRPAVVFELPILRMVQLDRFAKIGGLLFADEKFAIDESSANFPILPDTHSLARTPNSP